jgi:hypothetical protein
LSQVSGTSYCCAWERVSRRPVGHWVLLSRFGSPGFLAGARRVVGQCLRSVVQRRGASGWLVGSRRERAGNI